MVWLMLLGKFAVLVGAVIDYQSLAIFSGLIKLAGTKTAAEWVLHGGEDYELVLCLSPEFAAGLIANLGVNATIIGKIVKNTAIKLINTEGLVSEQTLNIGKGFQHF